MIIYNPKNGNGFYTERLDKYAMLDAYRMKIEELGYFVEDHKNGTMLIPLEFVGDSKKRDYRAWQKLMRKE